MKSVPDYIKLLLYEHDYVTIPNLGAFIANYQSASFNEISGSLMPPQKKIAFNEILKQDDGLLATVISRREGITIDESKRKIQSFVVDVKDALAIKHQYTLDKIGNLTINKERGLLFEPDRKANFYGESYGFDNLFPMKVNKVSGREQFDLQQKVYLEEDYNQILYKKKRKSADILSTLLYGVPVLLLIAGLFYIVFSHAPTQKSTLSSMIPLEAFDTTENISTQDSIKPASKPLVIDKSSIEKPTFEETKTPTTDNWDEPKIEKAPEKVVETPKVTTQPTENSTITNTTKRYSIVCGVFRNKENVEKLTTLLQKNGFSPRVSLSNDLMKVIAAEVDDMDEAKQIQTKLQTFTGEKGVIIKN